MDFRKNILHKIFRVSLFLKGLDSILEIIGGFLLLLFKPSSITNFVRFIFQHELLEDPHDLIGNFIISLSYHLSAGTQLFGVLYLLSHGLIKIALIIGLWKDKIKVYLLAEAVFIIFIIYQTSIIIFNHSVFLILLTILDIIVVVLTWWEYTQLKKRRNSYIK
jgi:uncharacterized membrane protein